jgi:hypothetical protein
MSDLAVTAASVAPVFPPSGDGLTDTIIRNYRAKVAITAGQSVFLDGTTGRVDLASSGASGTKQFRGIALTTCGVGDVVRVQEKGCLYGFTLTGLAFDALIYQSDTAGSLATAAGTATVPVGRVLPLCDNVPSAVLYIEAMLNNNW